MERIDAIKLDLNKKGTVTDSQNANFAFSED